MDPARFPTPRIPARLTRRPPEDGPVIKPSHVPCWLAVRFSSPRRAPRRRNTRERSTGSVARTSRTRVPGAFVQDCATRLAEGKNIVTERRFSEGKQERFGDLAVELYGSG